MNLVRRLKGREKTERWRDYKKGRRAGAQSQVKMVRNGAGEGIWSQVAQAKDHQAPCCHHLLPNWTPTHSSGCAVPSYLTGLPGVRHLVLPT